MNQTKIKTLATAFIMSVAMTATAQTAGLSQTDNKAETANPKQNKTFKMSKLYMG